MEEAGPNMLAAALAYASWGLPVFPVYEPGTNKAGCSCNDLRMPCSSPAKHPRTFNGVLDASTDPEQIRQWWTRWPRANIGIATTGFYVLDIDPDKGGDESLRDLEQRHGALPDCPVVLTGGGGTHYWMSHRGARNSSGTIAPGIDVRGYNGYVLAPPSLHVSGRRYEWDATRRPERWLRSN